MSSELDVLNERWKDLHSRYADWPDDVNKLEAVKPVIETEASNAADALTEYNKLISKLEKLRKAKEFSAEAHSKYIEESDKSLHDAEHNKTQADTTLKTEQGKTDNLKKQEKEKDEALKEVTKALEKANQEVEDKKTAIKAEIGDKDPDSFETELSNAKTCATNAVKEKDKAIGKLREEQQSLKGSHASTGKSLSEQKEKMKKDTASLSDWLYEFNGRTGQQLTVSDISALHSATDDWEAIRTMQNRLNTALTSASTTLANEETAHARHQETKPESTEDELKSKKTELEDRSNVELTDAKARMQRHDTASEKLGGLVEQKQAVELLEREWEEIYDSIGADGKTLRKIAQCYTLRFLIEHANAEIRKFNSRYELQQVKNSLGIRVIDHNRADDVRDTTSLSGGETFIVSLGLALGLSSLSSKNISFENLFIDEGFGTLDPDTLATVIDSLAMLQSSQGKKVGVISHTDTMSERITTQIRIVKNGNSGSSHIEFNP